MIKKYTINATKAISETLDNETIIINMETGNYYSMNAAGTNIWQAILNGKSFNTDHSLLATFLTTLVDEALIQEIPLSDETQTLSNSLLQKGEAYDLDLVESPTFTKYTDMQEMLLADPIHDVEEMGWPKLKEDH